MLENQSTDTSIMSVTFAYLFKSLSKYNGYTHSSKKSKILIPQLLFILQKFQTSKPVHLQDSYVNEGLPGRLSKLTAEPACWASVHSVAVVTEECCSLFTYRPTHQGLSVPVSDRWNRFSFHWKTQFTMTIQHVV